MAGPPPLALLLLCLLWGGAAAGLAPPPGRLTAVPRGAGTVPRLPSGAALPPPLARPVAGGPPEPSAGARGGAPAAGACTALLRAAATSATVGSAAILLLLLFRKRAVCWTPATATSLEQSSLACGRHLRFAVFALQKPKRRRAGRDFEAEVQVEVLDIKIRPMELRDTGPCFYLGEKTFVTGNLYRTWDEWEPVSLLSSSPEYCFVAELANGQVVGFVLGSVVHKKNVSIGYIDWVVVERGFQRLGVGTKLVDKVSGMMRGRENINLLMADTPAENVAAVDFFMKHLRFTESVPHVYLTRFRDWERPLAPLRVQSEATQGVLIRPIIVDDLFAIYQLGEKVFNHHANLSRMWDENEVMDMFSQNSEFCLVAAIDGDVAGFCLGTTVDKRKSKKPYGYLMWLAVDTKYGRRGIGSLLMRAFDGLMAAHGCNLTLVDTQADNEAALKFFEAQGFGDKKMHVYMSRTFDTTTGGVATTVPTTTLGNVSLDRG